MDKIKKYKDFKSAKSLQPIKVEITPAEPFVADEMDGLTSVGPLDGDEDAEKFLKQ
jgi:hypothetical protein